jgi:hypothetical protein
MTDYTLRYDPNGHCYFVYRGHWPIDCALTKWGGKRALRKRIARDTAKRPVPKPDQIIERVTL